MMGSRVVKMMGDGEHVAAACSHVAATQKTTCGPWKQVLQGSLKRNESMRESRYFQIATVRRDGHPSNRTVVYRGFLWDTDQLTFVTDSRSNKVDELQFSKWAEVTWYFPKTREQYRFHGQVSVVSKDQSQHDLAERDKLQRARVSAWKNMSDPGRQQFLWPHPLEPRAAGGEDAGLFQPPAPTKDDPVADTFCLCYITVSNVDHLCLKTNERWVYSRTDDSQEWQSSYVNP